MTKLWCCKKVKTIYPPCDTSHYIETCNLEGTRENVVVSFAQFRPEKRHLFQIDVFEELIKDERVPKDTVLVMIGSVRGPGDQELVNEIFKVVKTR